jgi:hypothetical protein
MHLAPISMWDSPNTPGSARPRVMAYIRKGHHLRYRARENLNHPDMLWAVVNGVAILNCYRQLHIPHVIQYVTHLIPPQLCLVGGDFNARHESFEPNITAATGGVERAGWAANASMDYIDMQKTDELVEALSEGQESTFAPADPLPQNSN